MGTHEFLDYIQNTKMTFAYKMVILAILLDENGVISQSYLITRFREYYQDRQNRQLPVERERTQNPNIMLKPDEVSDHVIWQAISKFPLELMREFIEIEHHTVRIKPSIWANLSQADLGLAKQFVQERLERHFANL